MSFDIEAEKLKEKLKDKLSSSLKDSGVLLGKTACWISD